MVQPRLDFKGKRVVVILLLHALQRHCFVFPQCAHAFFSSKRRRPSTRFFPIEHFHVFDQKCQFILLSPPARMMRVPSRSEPPCVSHFGSSHFCSYTGVCFVLCLHLRVTAQDGASSKWLMGGYSSSVVHVQSAKCRFKGKVNQKLPRRVVGGLRLAVQVCEARPQRASKPGICRIPPSILAPWTTHF